jgi:hypothetical protein
MANPTDQNDATETPAGGPDRHDGARSGWMMSCETATRLALEDQEVGLRWPTRLKLKVHLLMCRACARFARQSQLMERLMTRETDHEAGDAQLSEVDRHELEAELRAALQSRK